MNLKTILLAEFDREARRSRRALEHVPEGKYDWKPHDKSMVFGYLADMVATIPTWIVMQITQDELDVAPVDGGNRQRERHDSSEKLVKAFDEAEARAREAFAQTTDAHLLTTWTLKARGAVVQQASRFDMIQDTLNHWVHHRGQMTVYLRLLGAKVPAIYGPSADDKSFG